MGMLETHWGTILWYQPLSLAQLPWPLPHQLLPWQYASEVPLPPQIAFLDSILSRQLEPESFYTFASRDIFLPLKNCKHSLLSHWTCPSHPTTVSCPSQSLTFRLPQGTPFNLSRELCAPVGKLMTCWTPTGFQPGNVTWSPLLADNSKLCTMFCWFWGALFIWLMNESYTLSSPLFPSLRRRPVAA